MRVWFRADGNEVIASGHLRRCVSIAEELERRGAECLFLVADERSSLMLQKILDADRKKERHGAETGIRGDADSGVLGTSYDRSMIRVLGVPYGSPMKEIPVLSKLQYELESGSESGSELGFGLTSKSKAGLKSGVESISETKSGYPDWFFIDSYEVRQDYFDALYSEFAGTKIAFLDDMMSFDPKVDLVINYDPDTENLKRFYQKAAVKLLGPAYVPLRREFRTVNPEGRLETELPDDSAPRQSRSALKILISTGGSDPYGMADSLDQLVQDVIPAPVTTRIVAPGHPYVADMAALMRDSALAISAAGTTLYELCATHVPTISFSMSENQNLFGNKMDASGLVSFAGDVRTASGRESALAAIRHWLEEKNFDQYHQRNPVDGRGAQRIAEEMFAYGNIIRGGTSSE